MFACTAMLVLVWPASSPADHLSISANVSALLKERRSTDYWNVEISWTASCQNVTPGKAPVYTGELYMVDVDTGERHYVGAVADTSGGRTVSGKREWYVAARPREQHLKPEFTVNCYETFPEHGGPTTTVTGNAVTIPPRFGGRGGGGGGSGGGSGD